MKIETVGNIPVRIRRGWFGRLTLEVQETLHHCDDQNGSGYFDEYQTKSWRYARLADLIMTDLVVVD